MKAFLITVIEEYLYFWTDVLPFVVAAILVIVTILGIVGLTAFVASRFL